MAEVDLNTPESWSIARQYASLLSPIPASVCDCIQRLWISHNEQRLKPSEEIEEKNLDAIRRVDKTAKLKTPLYFAASALFADRMNETQEDDSSKALLRVLGPGLFAAFLGLVYLHRRLNKVASPEHWAVYSKEYISNMELGFLFGSCFPKLSQADGTLVGGIRYAALSALCVHSPVNYMKYRNLRKQKLIIEEEHSRWGCDHTQIAAYLLKDLGYAKDVLDTVNALRKIPPAHFSAKPEFAAWSASLTWMDLVKEKKNALPPNDCLLVLQASDASTANVHAKIDIFLEKGTTFGWMTKSKE